MAGPEAGDRRLLAQVLVLLGELLVDALLGDLDDDAFGGGACVLDGDAVLIFLFAGGFLVCDGGGGFVLSHGSEPLYSKSSDKPRIVFTSRGIAKAATASRTPRPFVRTACA